MVCGNGHSCAPAACSFSLTEFAISHRALLGLLDHRHQGPCSDGIFKKFGKPFPDPQEVPTVKLIQTAGSGGASVKDLPGGRFMVVPQRGPREVHQRADGSLCQVGQLAVIDAVAEKVAAQLPVFYGEPACRTSIAGKPHDRAALQHMRLYDCTASQCARSQIAADEWGVSPDQVTVPSTVPNMAAASPHFRNIAQIEIVAIERPLPASPAGGAGSRTP